MRITERKQQEKHQRRQLILDAAQRLFTEQGFEKVSLRNIAEVTDYSTTAMYHYFADKNELLHALQSRAFEHLAQQAQPVGQIASPVGRLRALGHLYLRFATEQPALFDLLFLLPIPPKAGPPGEQHQRASTSGQAAFESMVHVIQYGIDAGVFPHPDAELLALVVWGQLHGLATLALRQRLAIFSEARQAGLLEAALDLFVQLVSREQ